MGFILTCNYRGALSCTRFFEVSMGHSEILTHWKNSEKEKPMNSKGRLYRLIMRIAHHYHWHYAPPVYPEGEMQRWCKWCGLRQ